MRLSFLSESGKSLDVPAAILQEPLVVRGLLMDALFQCQARLPDTLDYLHAEHVIRDTLSHFQSDQERYARSYALSRILDQRTQKTPRADVIYQSFHHGGPLALVGIFYATLDAHRNLRSRETLDFFLQKGSVKSRLDLMKRVNTFPCNSSVVTWLSRILNKLDIDSQKLACILWHLGTRDIPKELFKRARIASQTWGSDGEIVGIASRTTPLIRLEELLGAALRNLEHVGFAYSTKECISLNPKVAEALQQHLEEGPWAAEAAKIIIHAFPKYRDIEPLRYVLLSALHCRDCKYS